MRKVAENMVSLLPDISATDFAEVSMRRNPDFFIPNPNSPSGFTANSAKNQNGEYVLGTNIDLKTIEKIDLGLALSAPLSLLSFKAGIGARFMRYGSEPIAAGTILEPAVAQLLMDAAEQMTWFSDAGTPNGERRGLARLVEPRSPLEAQQHHISDLYTDRGEGPEKLRLDLEGALSFGIRNGPTLLSLALGPVLKFRLDRMRSQEQQALQDLRSVVNASAREVAGGEINASNAGLIPGSPADTNTLDVGLIGEVWNPVLPNSGTISGLPHSSGSVLFPPDRAPAAAPNLIPHLSSDPVVPPFPFQFSSSAGGVGLVAGTGLSSELWASAGPDLTGGSAPSFSLVNGQFVLGSPSASSDPMAVLAGAVPGGGVPGASGLSFAPSADDWLGLFANLASRTGDPTLKLLSNTPQLYSFLKAVEGLTQGAPGAELSFANAAIDLGALAGLPPDAVKGGKAASALVKVIQSPTPANIASAGMAGFNLVGSLAGLDPKVMTYGNAAGSIAMTILAPGFGTAVGAAFAIMDLLGINPLAGLFRPDHVQVAREDMTADGSVDTADFHFDDADYSYQFADNAEAFGQQFGVKGGRFELLSVEGRMVGDEWKPLTELQAKAQAGGKGSASGVVPGLSGPPVTRHFLQGSFELNSPFSDNENGDAFTGPASAQLPALRDLSRGAPLGERDAYTAQDYAGLVAVDEAGAQRLRSLMQNPSGSFAVGAANPLFGELIRPHLARAELSELWQAPVAAGRMRAADLNGDGRLDLVHHYIDVKGSNSTEGDKSFGITLKGASGLDFRLRGPDAQKLAQAARFAPQAMEYIASHPDLIAEYHRRAGEAAGLDAGDPSRRGNGGYVLPDGRWLGGALFGLEHMSGPDGRAGASFDALQYALANPDLLAAFGSDRARLAEHYVVSGHKEGPNGTSRPTVPADPVLGALGGAMLESPLLAKLYAMEQDAVAARWGLSLPGTRKPEGFGALDAAKSFLAEGYAAGQMPGMGRLSQYLLANPSLLSETGSLEGVADHYLTHGRREVASGQRPGTPSDPAQAARLAGMLENPALAFAYGLANPDVVASVTLERRGDPMAYVEHFVRVGQFENRPGLNLDVGAFAEANPDLVAAYGPDLAALLAHVLARYEQESARLESGRLSLSGAASPADGPALPQGFDEELYLAANPDVADAVRTGQFGSALAHYQAHGQAEGRPLRPSLPDGFDEELYLAANPDVAQAVGSGQMESGVRHLLLHGMAEGRALRPSLPQGFDAELYLAANPDVASAVGSGQTESAARHYLLFGQAEGRGLQPETPRGFDEGLYLAANPDVAQAVRTGQVESGLRHYLLFGQTEGRPLRTTVPEGFDEDLYLAANPDVASAVAAGQIESGLRHLLLHGLTEGRQLRPGVPPGFEEAAYLAANPDVAEAVRAGQVESGLRHYLVFGRIEGRSLAPALQAGLQDIPALPWQSFVANPILNGLR